MLIRVVYTDNTHDYVKDSHLDRHLESGKVAKFQRSSGWVTVGVDPIRSNRSGGYKGPERRGAHVKSERVLS